MGRAGHSWTTPGDLLGCSDLSRRVTDCEPELCAPCKTSVLYLLGRSNAEVRDSRLPFCHKLYHCYDHEIFTALCLPMSLPIIPPYIFSLGHLAVSLLGEKKSKFPGCDGFSISIPSSSLGLFWCDRRTTPSRERGDTIYSGLQWFCSDRSVIYLPWETRGKDQNLMQGALADTSDVNWCKHHSATGEARTMCLIIMVQFPNSSKLVFILFWNVKYCVMYLFLEIVQGEWGGTCKCKY